MNVVALTRELVAFQSPSHESNAEVSHFIADRLRQVGFEMELVTYRDHAGVEKVNVLGRAGPDPARSPNLPGLAYFCHSDVVPADTWVGPGRPYAATEQDARLYGRGSCDMKGSAASMLCAIDRIDLTRLQSPLYFVCTADEEWSYAGAQQVVAQSSMYREMVKAQPYALIGEPTELQVVHAHKGICKLQITSHGEAAHSSTREGKNANLAMIPFLQSVKEIHDQTESSVSLHNTEFDPPTMSWNIGINDHTAAVNVKPARSVCTIFYRPLPQVDDGPLIDRVRQSAEQHGLEFAKPDRCDAMYTDPAAEIVQSALAITGQTSARTVAYGTDGGVLTELHHKIVCGPGSIAQAHTSDEWISLDQLRQGTQHYETFVQSWCVGS